MKILGIETSCDETAAAVVQDGRKILSSVVASSAEMHAASGGVIPEEAARQQIKSVLPVIQKAIVDAKGNIADIDAIAITVGPGLIGSLLVGIETARTLAILWKKPIIPVNHLVAHVYANFVDEKQQLPDLPALALVVSGGHTDLVLMRGHGKLEWIGGTRDDAAGEAFDKTARLLGLSYPGGPSIAKLADEYIGNNPKVRLNLFPRPLANQSNFDWSFSGLKTAVLREVQSNHTSLKLRRTELAAQVQEAIVDVLVDKTLRAVRQIKPKSLLLAGGVAANSRLREIFRLKIKIDFRVPDPKLCTDNAVYIAASAFFNLSPIPWQELKASPDLTIVGQV